jgi:D-glycero-alpha-D-manno-heptose 1-phosphate guanylyltransferase
LELSPNLALKKAIILAGGMGTRLQSVVADVPKPMAPVGGKPFLHYQFLFLKKHGIQNVVLSVGYKAEVIRNYFANRYENINIEYCVEQHPLGTGGGIKQALQLCNEDSFVLNGDTFFDIDLTQLFATHINANADATLALSHEKNFDRYGTVQFDEQQRITAFKEKKFLTEGWINGGIYFLNKDIFQKIETLHHINLPQRFSFETEVLEKEIKQLNINASLHRSYFIDIGIPDDYQRANIQFPDMF